LRGLYSQCDFLVSLLLLHIPLFPYSARPPKAADLCGYLIELKTLPFLPHRRALETLGFFDATRRIAPVPATFPPSPTSYVGIPVDARGLAILNGTPVVADDGSPIPEEVRQRLPLRTDLQLPPSAKARASGEESEQGRLAAALLQLRPDLGSLEAAAREAPQGWERHGDLVLLPDAALGGVAVRETAAGGGVADVDGGGDATPRAAIAVAVAEGRPNPSVTAENAETEDARSSRQWQALGQARWRAVADALRCQRVALKGRVAPDGVRHSGARLVLGEDGWVRHVDNGVVYTWDVTRCMFSRGNITEKLRVAALPCAGETVVDLYAGIGYFTLPYLVHAGAAHVYACEWNPEAVAALRQNLVLNKVRAEREKGGLERATLASADGGSTPASS
jgi:hypothetical protein